MFERLHLLENLISRKINNPRFIQDYLYQLYVVQNVK